jgi:uncharacterized protein
MDTTPAFSADIASQLTRFLAAPERPPGTMSYPELAGFLFAIACAPEPIEPPEWLPVIWGEDDKAPPFPDPATAQTVTTQIMTLYNHVAGEANAEQPLLPTGCEPRAEVLANLEAGAPLALWSRGFVDGLHYLEELWDAYMGADKELAEELDFVLIPLIFFSSREIAEAIHADSGAEGTFDDMAREMAEIFPEAMMDYVEIAHGLEQAAHTPATSNKVARNGSCPCGSGRKYKKCCGR